MYKEPPTLTLLKHYLDLRVKEWSDLGVFIPKPFNQTPEYLQWQQLKYKGVRTKKPEAPPPQADGQQLHNLIKECAKTSGRPLVTAYKSRSYGRGGNKEFWGVQMPFGIKTQPLYAMFLPISIEDRLTIGMAKDPVVVHRLNGNANSSPTKINFDVFDEKLFETWLDRVKNDPLFKKVLGTLPTG